MKSTELRIGNFIDTLTGKEVMIPRGVPMKILSISIGDCDVLEIDKVPAQEKYWPRVPLFNLSPIPLTPEWLERFGFKRSENGGNWKQPDYMIWEADGFKIGETVSDNFYWYNQAEDDFYSSYSPQLKHVHQLQNLYFALTGTELDPTDQNLK